MSGVIKPARDWRKFHEAVGVALRRERESEQPEPDDDDLPPIISGEEIASRVVKLPDEIIEGMLHRGAKMMLGGGSKSFKTWCLSDLAISIATGCPWWGRNVRQGKVLYLNLEVREAFFDKRLQNIAAAKGVKLQGNLEVWNLRGHCTKHDTLLPKISKRIAGKEYVALFVDPVYKIIGGSENDTEVIGALMDSIEKLAVSVNAAVIFGAHFAKGSAAGKEAIDRVSGSGVFARDPDAMMMMTKHEEDGAFTIDTILRDCPPVASFCVRWDYPLMKAAPDLDPAKLKQINSRNSGKSKTPPPVEEVLAVVHEAVGGNLIPGALNAENGLFELAEEKLNVTRDALQVTVNQALQEEKLQMVQTKPAGRRGRKQVFYKLDYSKMYKPRSTDDETE